MLVQIRGVDSTMIHSSPKLVKKINTGEHYKPPMAEQPGQVIQDPPLSASPTH